MDRQKKREQRPIVTSYTEGFVPPNAKILEDAVLGAIMIEKNAYLKVADLLKPEYFYHPHKAKIFRSAEKLFRSGVSIDLATIAERLHSDGELDEIGGVYELTRIIKDVVSSAHIIDHSRIIFEKYILRELIVVSGSISSMAFSEAEDPLELLSIASSKFRELDMAIESSKKVSNEDVAKQIIEDFDTEAYYSQNNLTDPNAVFTGFPDWDRLNGKLVGGLYVVAARPAVGKGIHMTEGICRTAKRIPVGVINAEMPHEQLMIRIGCNLAGISNDIWKKQLKSPQDQEEVKRAMQESIQLDMKLSDYRCIDDIVRQITSWHFDGVKIVFADMLNLFTVSETMARYMPTEKHQMNYILLTLAYLSKKLKMPIILYAHMNREVLKRALKEPNLGDLKDSGKIEDVAFQVSFLHRPELYETNTQQTEDEWGEDIRGLLYQIVVKNRGGANGRIKYDINMPMSKLTERVPMEVAGGGRVIQFTLNGLSQTEIGFDDITEDNEPF